MPQTLNCLILFGVAFFLTWIVKLVFKLKLTGAQFGLIATLIGTLLVTGMLFCPAIWNFLEPR